MKKIAISALISLSILSFTACTSKDKPYTPNSIEGECIISGEKAPVWVCGSYNEEKRYVASGSAPLSKLGHNFSRNEAVMNARTDLVNQIEIEIKNKAESYMRATGLKENELVEKVVTQVSKQTASLTLKNTKQISYWQSQKDNTIYVLMAVDKNELEKIVDENIKEIVDNELQIRNSEDALNRLN